MKRVAAYCRVSTDKEDQANSFESQKRYFEEYISNRKDWILVEIYADDGVSGTNTKKRKEFRRMIADAKLGKFDLILTKEITRFARNTLDSIQYTRELKAIGVGVIFCLDNINTLETDGEVRLTIMASLAQDESRRTSERVKWGQRRRMEQGVVFGRDLLGYDVRDGKMSINPEGAKVVRYIFEEYLSGNGCNTIAKQLQRKGIKTLAGNSNWSNTTILKILRNEKYCGDLVQCKTWTPDYLSHAKKYNHGEVEKVYIRNHHEPIIERRQFEAVQEEIKRRSPSDEIKSRYSNRFCFSGKVYCGNCGHVFVGRNRKNAHSSYKTWKCSQNNRYGVPKKMADGNMYGCTNGAQIRDEVLKSACMEAVSVLNMNRKELVEQITSLVSSVLGKNAEPDTKQNKLQIEQIEAKQKRLLDLYLEGCLTKKEYLLKKEEFDRKCEELMASDAEASKSADKEALLQEIKSFCNSLVKGEQWDDTYYREIIDRIVVYEKNIRIYFKMLNHPIDYRIQKQLDIKGNDTGTEELGHLEMVGALVSQLTRNLSIEEIQKSGFDKYFVDHTTGVYPQAASGTPFSAMTLQSVGDPITNLVEDMAAEQKARTTYDNILRLVDDPDVKEVIRFLRMREIIHFQRFGECLSMIQDDLNSKNFYACNPSFDKDCGC